jgi:citrate synthase
MPVTDIEVRKGLAGVYADTTAISKVNPETNSLTYRGYPVQELARRCSFEEVAYLLWHGELPTREQLAAQNQAERAQRTLDPLIAATLIGLPLTAHPMDTLRAAVSLLGASDPAENDNSPRVNRAKSLRLFAVLPAIIALDQRRRHGLGAVSPREELGFAANFLYMTFGQVPEPTIVSAFETSLILYAEHSFDASTFTARVVTSTLSDLYSAVTAAIGALKGPLHGGANEAVMDMLDEIVIPDNAGPWLDEALADKRKIMGFGHRVYKNGDSRVPTMRAALSEIAAIRGGQNLIEVYETLAQAMFEAKGLRPNLGYPAGPAYHLIGFDTPTFTPIFVAARLPGWTAHIAEQLAANSLIRPLAAYDGPAERHVPQRRPGTVRNRFLPPASAVPSSPGPAEGRGLEQSRS